MMAQFHPLNDILDDYSMKLDKVEEADLADDVIWPNELFIGETEREDVKEFLNNRMHEIISQSNHGGGLNMQSFGAFLFKSLVSGMLWERERHGR